MRARTLTALLTAVSLSFALFPLHAEEEQSILSESTTVIRHKEESVQWVPHSVTVLDKEELDRKHRTDIEDIESRIPGLIVDRMNTTPRGAAIALRGLGSNSPAKSFDPAVAVNIDGVYVGTHTGRLQVLFDFEKIEVARGPQGTLDGNPNLSGSINLQRSKPTGELEVDARISTGIDNRSEVSVVVNFPVVDSVNGKIAAFRRNNGGEYMKNVFNGRDENTEDYSFLSATLAWELEDWLSLTYTYDYEVSDEATPALLNISASTDLLCANTASLPFPNCSRGIGNPELDSLKTTAQNFSNDRDFDSNAHTLRMDFEVAGHQIRTITGLRSNDEKSALDLDASNADFYHVAQFQNYDQFSQELLISRDYSEKLKYQIGAYFLNTDYDIFQQEFHILKQIGDAGYSEGHAAAEIQELRSSQKSNLRSLFASANYVINDQWIADLSARWSDIDRDMEHSPSRIRLGNTLSPLRTFIVSEETTKQFLISGGLSYKVDEAAMIYMRYSEGFLPGGFDENAMSAAAGNSYGPETVRNAEIGLKSDWWDDRLRVNFVYYRMELDHKVERFDAVVEGGQIESILDNVSEVEIAGWELEVESIPMDNLHVNFVYSQINGNYDKFSIPDIANPGTFISSSSLTPTYAPDENLYLGANYAIPFGPGVVRTYAGYRLFSDYQTYPLLPEAEVKNWTSWDLSVSYEWQEWVFRLFSNNVKNKEFIQNIRQITQTDILPVTAGSTAVPSLITYTEYNQPRYTGLEVIYRPDFNR